MRFDLGDQAPYGVGGGALVGAGGGQGGLALGDAQRLERADQRVPAANCRWRVARLIPAALATSSMVAVDLRVSRAAALRSTCSRSTAMRRRYRK